jgi:hypothetical protein
VKFVMLLITFFGLCCTTLQVAGTIFPDSNKAYCEAITKKHCHKTGSDKPLDESPLNKDLADQQDASQDNEDPHALDEDQILNPNLLSFNTALLVYKAVPLYSNYDQNFYHFNYQFSHLRPPC